MTALTVSEFSVETSNLTYLRPEHVVDSAWITHTAFAFWITGATQPRLLVELGTHNGQSYLAFCQAISQLQLPAKAIAVDTWQGDEHAGFYGEEVLQELRRQHDDHYGEFSTLAQMTFAEALSLVEDGSVDLLHIDGRHLEEDAWEDFNTWLPKVSDRGVVLFHDVHEFDNDFGVYRVWNVLKERYPSFEFLHGHGLGVLAVGENAPAAVLAFLAAAENTDVAERTRLIYQRLGGAIEDQLTVRNLHSQQHQKWLREQELETYSSDLAQQLNAALDRSYTATLCADTAVRGQLEAQAELTKTKRELQKVKKRLAEVQASTSWKITKPLRAARSRGVK